MQTKTPTDNHLYIFDTTLRDGAQTQGVNFSVSEKQHIALMLDQLGVDYIEGGFPGANPTDTAFFDSPPHLSQARLTAFGMTRRAGRSIANDPGLAPLLNSQAPVICLVGKSWDMHVKAFLDIALETNLTLITESIAAVIAAGKEAIFDAEHFFDGYRDNPDYACACLDAALQAGARWGILCDTNGGTLPDEIATITATLCQRFGGQSLGIHAHNDTGNAVANTLAAIQAGVRQIQGTLNGLGERCGNADLATLLPTLLLKPAYADLSYSVSKDSLRQLRGIAHSLDDDILNRPPNRHAPYIGAAAFTHKGGIHASAVVKNPRSYEHIDPDLVGNWRHIPMSDQAGRANLRAALKRFGITMERSDQRLEALLARVKEYESNGYSYDSADASFELLIRRELSLLKDYFDVERYRVTVEQRHNALGALVTVSEAVVMLRIDDQTIHSVAEGNGPINALDSALRKDLGKYSAILDPVRLVDYKVRIFDRGTAAVTRVQIESRDKDIPSWITIGISSNIVAASFDALVDSLRYRLMRADNNRNIAP